MAWLNYVDDEVTQFHPAFELAAAQSLSLLGLSESYEWVHHIRTAGNTLIPDFVLRESRTGKWVLVLEMKRRRETVHSSRAQAQAKSYAEFNQDRYKSNIPKFFAISNLEDTILFALNGNRPPRECRITDGFWNSGSFIIDTATDHIERFVQDLTNLIELAISGQSASFEHIWPRILTDYLESSLVCENFDLETSAYPDTANWETVRSYFGNPPAIDDARLFVLRCLSAEYLRGILLRDGHPLANSIPFLRSDTPRAAQMTVAQAISRLRSIDFQLLFEDFAPDIYRDISHSQIKDILQQYIRKITTPPTRVCDLAMGRVDYLELLDNLLDSLYPTIIQDDTGKVQTDMELAILLASITIPNGNVQKILDPCCGDGMLLSAAYERLTMLNVGHFQAVESLTGIEVDSLATRLASLRLALKNPRTLNTDLCIDVVQGDMFASEETFRNADVVLMNPPFKRYEAQDGRAIPRELREYYSEAITSLDGAAPISTGGQANIYNYYVEYAIKSVPEGTKLGIILDNKWYQNQYAMELRRFIIDNCLVDGIIEYPHQFFFKGWAIATSILVLTKSCAMPVEPEHRIKFVKCRTDPRHYNPDEIAFAFSGDGEWPLGWTCNEVRQSSVKAEDGWKKFFSSPPQHDYKEGLAALPTFFEYSRRGSLNKEEGGVGVFEFPFERSNYGYRRELSTASRPRAYQTDRGLKLNSDENRRLMNLSRNVPADFKGWALKNSSGLNGFELTVEDVERNQVIEPPILRDSGDLYRVIQRVSWSSIHDFALSQIEEIPEVQSFVSALEETTNLTDDVLAKEKRWIALREPVAGELIIPRKMRQGHRVHVNPFVFNDGRQVRLSSNFISYANCLAVDGTLNRLDATRLIAAFLVSSFGQLQFELEGYNREGCLSLEAAQLSRVVVLDPRSTRPENRRAILEVFQALEYPIRNNLMSCEQLTRNQLDELFASELCHLNPLLDFRGLLEEVHNELDQLIESRQI